MKASTEISKFDNDTIRRLSRLLQDGNNQLQQNSEKDILLLGNINVGKSTLAYVLSGKKLKAVMDKETNELVITALEPLDGFVIGQETKLPTKCLVGKIGICELPCLDNSDPVEEIAKIVYMNKLFAFNNLLKFILLIPESGLKARNGVELFETVSDFIDLFKDIEYTEGSVALVVTKVSKRKNVQNIRKIIEDVLKCHHTVPEKHRAFISELIVSSLYLLHEPSENRGIDSANLLDCIDSSGKYVEGKEDIIRMELSDAGKTLASQFLQTTCDNVNKIIEVTAKAILDISSSLNINALKVFSELHENCKDLIPPSVLYKDHQFMNSKYFLELKLLSMLKNALSAHKVSSVSELVKMFEHALEVFPQFAKPSCICRQIQDITYLLQREYEYVKFFSGVCEVESLNGKAILQLQRRCYKSTKKNFENALFNLCIDESKEDDDYYHQAVDILKNYENYPACMKQLEIANRRLAEIKRPQYGYAAFINIIQSVIVYILIMPRRILSIPLRLIEHFF